MICNEVKQLFKNHPINCRNGCGQIQTEGKSFNIKGKKETDTHSLEALVDALS